MKSSSYRVASRAVNALGAGTPVLHYAEMKRATLWVVSVPHKELPYCLEELRKSGLEWTRRNLLILDSEAQSEDAAVFRALGASVATFAPVDTDGSKYVVEGDVDAVRAVRSLVEGPNTRRVIEVRKGAKQEYLKGAQSATQRVLPLIAEAVERFQSAGLSNSEAKAITETLLTGAMRSYFRAGRRAIKS